MTNDQKARVLLCVRFSRADDNETTTYTRSYEDGGILLEMVAIKTRKAFNVTTNQFRHWFWRKDMLEVMQEYVRWGWTVVEFNRW